MTMKTLTILVAALAVSFASAQCDAGQGSCCGEAKSAKVQCEDTFLAEAARMTMQAEGRQECCKSTATKPMAKGDKGCCNEVGTVAKFKVYADGKYFFFGCKDSAAMGRKDLMQKGFAVGDIQKVRSRARIG